MEQSSTEVAEGPFAVACRIAIAVFAAGAIAGALRAAGGKRHHSSYGGWTQLSFDSEEAPSELK